MSLAGRSSLHSLFHDIVESLIHATDKLILSERKNIVYIPVEVENEFEFKNEFPSLAGIGIYLAGPPIKTRKQSAYGPSEWDFQGTLTEFSAGSEVANLREFFIQQERKRRGRRGRGAEESELPVPINMKRTFLPAEFQEVGWQEYFDSLLEARKTSDVYHRRALGAEDREYWKQVPISSNLVEGQDVALDYFFDRLAEAKRFLEKSDTDGLAEMSNRIGVEKEAIDEKPHRKKAVPSPSDLRRYTVNAHPALARAMSLMVAAGNHEEVKELMTKVAPKVASEFERVTGRQVLGISIHFDSNLPHWNLWHSGLEPVIYKVGNSDRTRFRRTAMNLNSSGNMLAWDRVKRSFERLGEDFRKISLTTCRELEKAEARAKERQGRAPGDFTINRFADQVLEEGLKDLKQERLIERGFREFCENERKRYAEGAAGPNPKKLAKERETLTQALNPVARESLPEAAKRVVEERDRALEQLANLPPPVIKEVIPPALEGVLEVWEKLPWEKKPNPAIGIANLWKDYITARGKLREKKGKILLLEQENKDLKEKLTAETSLRQKAEATAKKLSDQVAHLKVFAKRLLNAVGKQAKDKLIAGLAAYLKIPREEKEIE